MNPKKSSTLTQVAKHYDLCGTSEGGVGKMLKRQKIEGGVGKKLKRKKISNATTREATAREIVAPVENKRSKNLGKGS